jgi:hypothetical protein
LDRKLTELTIPKEIEQLLLVKLKPTSKAQPLKEYDLLKALTAAGYPQFDTSGDTLALFQAHFMLFHLLYRLQPIWQVEGHGKLNIHTLSLYFEPEMKTETEENSQTLSESPVLLHPTGEFDGLKAYYLDFEHYHQTQTEEVQAMLDDFWISFAKGGYSQKDRSLSERQARRLLNLPDSGELTHEQIKRHYQQARSQHHPDKGGSADTFHQMTLAYQTLTF